MANVFKLKSALEMITNTRKYCLSVYSKILSINDFNYFVSELFFISGLQQN